MKGLFVYLLLFMLALLSACDFNINDSPGPQMSFSIKEAKKHGTFICAYSVKDSVINGIKISSIFAEKKFWRDEGFWEKKTINCSESQLVIITDSCLSCDGIGPYDNKWNISGFDLKSGYAICASFKGITFHDKMPIRLIRKTKNGYLDSTVYLAKVKDTK